MEIIQENIQKYQMKSKVNYPITSIESVVDRRILNVGFEKLPGIIIEEAKFVFQIFPSISTIESN